MHFYASSCIQRCVHSTIILGLCAIEMSVIIIILTVIYIPWAIHRRICTSRCSQKQADLFRGPIRELQLVQPMEATGGSGRMKLNEEGGCETSMSLAGAASSNILAKAQHAAGLNSDLLQASMRKSRFTSRCNRTSIVQSSRLGLL